MVLLRTAALRRPITQRFAHGVGSSVRAASRPSWQHGGRRGYADAAGGIKQGSDLPWAIGAVVVTIPSVWYLLQPAADAHGGDHGSHGDHGDAHSEKAEASADKEEGGDEKPDDSPKEESEDEQKKAEGKDEEENDENKEEKDDKDSKDDKPDSDDKDDSDDKSDSDGAKKPDDTSSKGPGKQAKDDVRKKEPSSKSDTGEKKRVDSALRKPQGAAGEEDDISSQQSKISNAPTMHSTDQMQNPEQSKKPEGAPDTAKLPKPVDPKR